VKGCYTVTLIRVTAFSKDLPAFEKTESKSSPPPWEGSNKGISNFTASKIFLKLCISVTMYHSSFIFSIFSFNVHRICMPCRWHGPHTALCSAPVVQPDVLQRCIGPTDPVSACVTHLHAHYKNTRTHAQTRVLRPR
jgi:hypothetical protein